MKNKKTAGRPAASGALAGLCCGLFGGGGGMVLIPLLTRWLRLETRQAFATCVAVIAPLSLVSAGIYLFRGRLDVLAALPYMAGGVLGGFLAGKTFQKVPVPVLRKGLAILLLYGGVRALFWS